MKKILTISLFLICSFIVKGQYPIQQNLGGPTTLVKNPNYGGLQGGLIPYSFADTSAANTSLQYLKTYNGALIFTTDCGCLWFRYNNAWIQILPAGGGGGGGGTLAWVMPGNNPVVTDGSGYAKLGPIPANGLSFITSDIVRLSINTNGALGLGSSRDFGTSGYLLQSNGSGSAPSWVPAPSGSTPTWQQTLTAGSTLNTDNTVDGGGHTFNFVNNNILQFGATSSGAGSLINIAQNSNGGSVTSNIVLNDSISLTTSTGKYYLSGGILNVASQNNLLGIVTSTGQAGRITIGTGLSLSGGQLTNTGVLATPTWQQTLDAGSTLTHSNVIDMDGNDFTWSNSAGIVMQGAYLSVSSSGSPISISDSSFNSEQGIHIGRGVRFDGMLNATTQNRLIGQTSSSGTLGYITLGTTNGFTSSLSSGAFSLTTTVTNNQLMYSSSGAVTGSSNLTYNGTTLAYASGVTTGSTTTSGLTETYNSLTTGTGNYISSSSITTGNLLNLVSSSTAANGFSLANLSSSGANANSTRTATGLTISVTNTGTSSTNVGLNVTASGGTTNRAISSTGTVRMTSLGTASGDTTTYKPMGINSSGDLIGMTYWPGSGGGGTPAGSNTQIQYNNSGAFGASANFTYDGARISLTRNTADDIMNVLLTSGHDAGITFKHSNPIYKMSIWMDDAAANLNFGNTLGSTPAFVLFRSSNNMTVGGTSDGGYRFDVQTGGARIIESAYLATGSGNVGIGGTTAGASAAASLGIFNGTAPTGSITNGIILYAEDVAASSELKVRDEAGNITVLSPHNFSKLPTGKPSEDLAWSYYSERNGKYISVDMAKAIRTIEELTQRVGTLEQKLQLKSKPPVKLIYKGKVKK